MRRRVLALLPLLAACGDAPPREPPPPAARIDTIGGVVHVTSDRALGWADTSGWRLVEERVVDPPEGSEGQIGTVEGLALADDGTLYVMQRGPARVLVFGPDGAYRRTIGREGDGPGDIHVGALGLRGDTLLIQQPGNARLTAFRTDGTHLSEVPSACCDHGRTPIMFDTAGHAWVAGLPRDTMQASHGGMTIGMRFSAWSLFDAAGRRTAVVDMPKDTMIFRGQRLWRGGVAIEGRRAAAAMVVPLQPMFHSAPRRDGTIVSGRTDAPTLLITDRHGDSLRVLHLPFAAVPLTDADRAALLARYVPANSPFHAIAKGEDLGVAWPHWTALVIDPVGRIWLGRPGDGREIARAGVVDPTGAFLGDVPIPGESFFSGAWNGTRLAIAGEDGDGRPVVRIYRLETR